MSGSFVQDFEPAAGNTTACGVTFTSARPGSTPERLRPGEWALGRAALVKIHGCNLSPAGAEDARETEP